LSHVSKLRVEKIVIQEKWDENLFSAENCETSVRRQHSIN